MHDEAELTARIHSRETFGTVDGPGIRYVVFFQGCPLQCLFCHNRDTWDAHAGETVGLEALLSDVLSYKAFIDSSGGGFTATGGEPLMQARFVATLFERLQRKGVHTALDTSGYRRIDTRVDTLLDHTDLVLLDIKHLDDVIHRKLVGVPNAPILSFADHLAARNQRTWLRHVVVPGYSDDPRHSARLADYAAGLGNIERVELLPYHEMGAHKWEALGYTYELKGTEPPPAALMREIKAVFEERGLTVSLSD